MILLNVKKYFLNFCGKKYFLNFCGSVLISLLTIIIFLLFQSIELIEELFSNQIISFIVVFIAYFIAILILSKIYNNGILQNNYKKISLRSFLEYDKKYVLLTLSLLILSMLLLLPINKVTDIIFSQVDSPDIQLSFIFLIGAFTYGPIIEELIFRGIFFNIASDWIDMNNKTVKNTVIIINIIMFMSLHYVSYNLPDFNVILSLLIAIIPRLAISISLTYVYMKTKDIKYNIILHIVYNFLIFSINYILTSLI